MFQFRELLSDDFLENPPRNEKKDISAQAYPVPDANLTSGRYNHQIPQTFKKFQVGQEIFRGRGERSGRVNTLFTGI
jgi:hypothetical protein